MVSGVFIREEASYSVTGFAGLLKTDADDAGRILHALLSHDIVKQLGESRVYSPADELNDADSAGDADPARNECCFAFVFVGIILFEDYIFKIYPKYFSHVPDDKEMSVVVRALEHYNNVRQFTVHISSFFDEREYYNPLAAILFLYRDYMYNGIYTSTKEYLQRNGPGEIDWNTTIDEIFPVLQNGRPFYMDYYTAEITLNDIEWISRLHSCILTLASRKLHNLGLSTLFSLDPIELYSGELEDFGDIDYIEKRILQEIRIQFNTKKQLVLRALYAFVHMRKDGIAPSGFLFYGTKTFHAVWEKMCAEVFASQLSAPLPSLPLTLCREYAGMRDLLSIIPTPRWLSFDGMVYFNSKATLKPDLACIVNANGKQFFVILDAKYYDFKLDHKGLSDHSPGIEDIDKQYLYLLAYLPFIQDHDLIPLNIFLFPGENERPEVLGSVEMPLFNCLSAKPAPVLAVKLPAQEIMKEYLFDVRVSLADTLPTLFQT